MYQSEFMTIFRKLCSNYNKDPENMKDKYDLIFNHYKYESANDFERAVNTVCNEEQYFPSLAVINKAFKQIKPQSSHDTPDFPYCQVCEGRGRVSMILEVEDKLDPNGRRTGKRKLRNRYVWTIENRNIEFEKPHYRQNCFAYCICEKGRYLYQQCGNEGIVLSEREFDTEKERITNI